jgi:hypothetical protein
MPRRVCTHCSTQVRLDGIEARVVNGLGVQVFDWDKDEAHRFLGSLKVSLEELVCAEEGVTDKEFDLVDDEGDRGIATISLRFTYRSVASIGEATVRNLQLQVRRIQLVGWRGRTSLNVEALLGKQRHEDAWDKEKWGWRAVS